MVFDPDQSEKKEIVFSVFGQEIAARRWHRGADHKILALHGWLDNCASFDFLAAQLPFADIVALDLPGHGKSYHRTHPGSYNIWQDIAEIAHVIEQLGWSQYTVIGHSRGAMIATLFTACFTEKIEKLVAIEAIIPEPTAPQSAPEQLLSAVAGVAQACTRPRRYYSNFDAAVASRMHGFTPLCNADAEVLAKRGVASNENGYYWANDAKLMVSSEVKYTEAQVAAFIDKVNTPVLLLLANGGLLDQMPGAQQLITRFQRIQSVKLDGGHHLHMSAGYRVVAEKIKSFILDVT